MFLNKLKFLFLLFGISVSAQPNTEVYLADISISDEEVSVSEVINISNDPGYDNQPSFQSDNVVLFAANNGGQTDIAQYDIQQKKKSWYHKGSGSSQYSPQAEPGSEYAMAVHLDSTGYQRLFLHDGNNSFREAHPDLRVAYFKRCDASRILATVLSDEGMDLVMMDLKKNSVDTLLNGAGRSLHQIPGTKSMSYTALNEEGNFDIYQYDLERNESFFVTQLPIGVQDHVWLDDARILIGSGERLYLYDPFIGDEWAEVGNFSEKGIENITRLSVSSDKTKLAIVAQPRD